MNTGQTSLSSNKEWFLPGCWTNTARSNNLVSVQKNYSFQTKSVIMGKESCVPYIRSDACSSRQNYLYIEEWEISEGIGVLTYGLSGVQLGMRRHRSRMMRMMMTQDCRLAALAYTHTHVSEHPPTTAPFIAPLSFRTMPYADTEQ